MLSWSIWSNRVTNDEIRTIQWDGCVMGVQGALGDGEGPYSLDWGIVAKERILEKGDFG